VRAEVLARKAIWGLGKTPGPEAERALRRLLDEPDEIIREYAKKQLARRNQL
jgi:HEAT repeat protein